MKLFKIILSSIIVLGASSAYADAPKTTKKKDGGLIGKIVSIPIGAAKATGKFLFGGK
jgi:hypothetical protein